MAVCLGGGFLPERYCVACLALVALCFGATSFCGLLFSAEFFFFGLVCSFGCAASVSGVFQVKNREKRLLGGFLLKIRE